MTYDIKHFKPEKHTRYQNGIIQPRTCNKLYESQLDKPVIYRSSYEYKFIKWCEWNKHIVKWGSECVKIPYILNNTHHHYFPDFLLTMDNGDVWLVEIKPNNQTKPPVNQNSYAWEQWIKNKAKWKAAIEYCNQRGWKFKIFTENTISKLL